MHHMMYADIVGYKDHNSSINSCNKRPTPPFMIKPEFMLHELTTGGMEIFYNYPKYITVAGIFVSPCCVTDVLH